MTTPYHMPPPMVYMDPDIQVAEAAIPEDVCDRIRAYGDLLIRLKPLPAKVGFHDESREVPEKRSAVTQWLAMPGDDPSTKWIYDMGSDIIQQANGRVWQANIWGFYDQLHYVQYPGPPDHGPDCLCGEWQPRMPGHFGWHQDRGDDWQRPARKLAFTLLLSRPDEYEGGEFQIFDGREITIKMHAKGSVAVFPSFVQHRVLPVTKGVRRSLIGWACGPKWT